MLTIAAGAALAASGSARSDILPAVDAPASDPWNRLPEILARIRPPAFPDRDFDITNHGAVGDNQADNTNAFRKAIAACAQAGGGRVVVPKGAFLTGAIDLMSNVNLHIVDGATVRFSRDVGKYPV